MPDEKPHRPDWRTLSSERKRRRLLAAADKLFAREGVDFPMPALAAELGVGVGSIYRQVAGKEQLLTELVIERLTAFKTLFERALRSPDPTAALFDAIQTTLRLILDDHIATIAFDLATDDPDVEHVRNEAAAVLQQLVDHAITAGALRPDATATDLRILFRAARQAEHLHPGGGQRLTTIALDGLRQTETSETSIS